MQRMYDICLVLAPESPFSIFHLSLVVAVVVVVVCVRVWCLRVRVCGILSAKFRHRRIISERTEFESICAL